jgi:hypothetical protein
MRRSYVVPMRWMVIYEYEVPGGGLNLSSTELPRLCGPSRSYGIATDYVLNASGIESWLGASFLTHVQNGPGAHPASCTMGTGSFPGVKQPERGADHPPPSSDEVAN